jgi:predicted esterase
VLVYPPSPRALGSGSSAPVVTMLHGMCSEPAATCELGRTAATAVGWFVCPTGNASCGDAADWTGRGETKAAFLDQSLAALDQAYGPFVARGSGDVLIGFSRGAFVARDVAYVRPNRWVGLVLLGAAMVPDAARLKASGIRRVVLGAGDFDGARPTMLKAAAVLSRAGLPTRFVSLGPIYHALPRDLDRILADALEWVRSDATA